MKTCLRFLLAAAALFPLVSCDKPAAPSAANVIQTDPALDKTQEELAAARDALQRQALEIETKTALMDRQLADMAQALKERENVELRSSLDALKKQNDDLRSQADAARRQSNVITQKIAPLPQVSVNVNVPAPRDYSLFYDQLGSYGRWFDVSGYGYCWRPTITTPRWRPYLDGCWMWSSFGWMWQSNEPFGWIVYHYGRWVNLSRYGWVWVPGSEWAPAWVAWRQSRDYVGWAPLPPDSGPCRGVYRDCDSHYNLGPSSYTFINTNVFMQPTYTSVCAPVTYNTSIFQSSVNVTQIVRCDDHKRPNTFMHHGGPPRTQIERACERPVQQVQVQTASADQIPRHRPGYHREPGASQPVIVDLPVTRTGAPPVRPQIAEHIDNPKRVDAFEGMPQRVAQEIRQTIAEEKATAVVQQQPAVVEVPSRFPHRSERLSAPVGTPVSQEIVRPAIAVEDKPTAPAIPPIVANETSQAPANRDSAEMTSSRRHRGSDATRPEHVLPMQKPSESSQPVIPGVVSTPEPEKPVPAVVVMPAQPSQPVPVVAVEPPPAVAAPVLPVAAETTPPQPSAAEKMNADAAAEAQRQRQEVQQRAVAEKMAAEQQTAVAEAEKARMQAATEQTQREQAQAAAMQQKQREEQAAQQRAIAEKMAVEQAQAAAETERAHQQAETVAMQRQQEEQAAQQRAAAEKMAAEQAQAAAEAERARQQTEAAAMQRQQEEATRRAQEMAQRQAEEQARRAAEEQMRREQEMAQRRAEEEARRQAEAEMRRAQEMAQRQAEEQARRAAEEQMRRAQEMAQRQAEEAARRQAEEQMRRAQEEAQRAAQEAAQRAAQEAARNQPQPNPGS